MLRHYATVAYRNLVKQWFYSLINVVGLALGMTATLLIAQYVLFETSYDAFHRSASRIYRVRSDFYRENELLLESAQAYPGVGPALKKDYPQVEAFVRLVKEEGTVRYRAGEQEITFPEQRMYYADATFPGFFNLQWVEGNDGSFSELTAVLLSESSANKYFKGQQAVGKTLRVGSPAGDRRYTVTGVFRDLPANSHLKIDLLLSNEVFVQNFTEPWSGLVALTYVLLKPGSGAALLASKLPGFVESHLTPVLGKAGIKAILSLQPLPGIHLHSDLSNEASPAGSAQQVYFLVLVALFILAIAYANFVNLATARAVDRAGEVGIRKAIGAQGEQLIGQFFSEAMLLNFLSAATAGLLVALSTQ